MILMEGLYFESAVQDQVVVIYTLSVGGDHGSPLFIHMNLRGIINLIILLIHLLLLFNERFHDIKHHIKN